MSLEFYRKGKYVIFKKNGNIFRVGIFLISVGGQAPHVLRPHMGVHRTCGEPNVIELTATHGLLNGC